MDWYRLCLYWALKPSHCELFLFSPIPMFFHKSLSLAEDWTRVSVSEVFMGQHFCDNDNMAVNPSESGFVTLASIESGFVNNDIYEFSPDPMGRSKESGWVENEIYGY